MCDQENNLTLESASLDGGAAESLDHARLPTNVVRHGIDGEARQLGKGGYASGFSLQRVMMHAAFASFADPAEQPSSWLVSAES